MLESSRGQMSVLYLAQPRSTGHGFNATYQVVRSASTASLLGFFFLNDPTCHVKPFYSCLSILSQFSPFGSDSSRLVSVLCPCRSKVTVSLASALVETTRVASLSTNAVMATGTVQQAAMRRAVRCARLGSFLAIWTLWPATQPQSAAITRSSARTGRMRRTATSASPETSTAEPTFAFLKRGSATARRTAWTGATRGTAWQPCPGK